MKIVLELALIALVIALFRRWLWANRARVLKASAVGLAATVAICLAVRGSLHALKAYWSYQPPCQAPCDLFNPAGGHCRPLALKLELAKPEARVGKHYTLFYRYSLTNVSCARIETNLHAVVAYQGFPSEYLRFHAYPDKEIGFFLRITGPDGKPVKQAGSPEPAVQWDTGKRWRSKSPTEYGEVAPYADAETQDQRLRADLPTGQVGTPSRGAPTVWDQLEPGQVVHSVASKVWPHVQQWNIETLNPDEPGTSDIPGVREYNTDIPEAGTTIRPPAPPPGFRVLDNFVFKRPGAYRIQAVYDHAVFAERIYPRWEALPERLKEAEASLFNRLAAVDFWIRWVWDWDPGMRFLDPEPKHNPREEYQPGWAESSPTTFVVKP